MRGDEVVCTDNGVAACNTNDGLQEFWMLLPDFVDAQDKRVTQYPLEL